MGKVARAQVVFFALIGMLATFFVSAVASMRFDKMTSFPTMVDFESDDVYIELDMYADWGCRQLERPQSSSFSAISSFVVVQNMPSWSSREWMSPTQSSLVAERATGWPFIAFKAVCFQSDDDSAVVLEGGSRFRQPKDEFDVLANVIPWRPVPLGLVLDSGIYGSAVGISWMILSVGRAAYRSQRGHCKYCGYDIRSAQNPVCSECGARLQNAALKHAITKVTDNN